MKKVIVLSENKLLPTKVFVIDNNITFTSSPSAPSQIPYTSNQTTTD